MKASKLCKEIVEADRYAEEDKLFDAWWVRQAGSPYYLLTADQATFCSLPAGGKEEWRQL
jgi:hypothetical protein